MDAIQRWYESWWMTELPGQTWADVWYDRLYDWRLRERDAKMIKEKP
jgi:hypothetical protein